MKFNLSNLNPGTWFWFDNENEENGGVCLRVVNRQKLEEIRKKTVKISYEYKNGQRFENRDIDSEKSDLLLWDYIIVDWKKIFTDDDEEIPCTTEMKVKLMAEEPLFGSFVQEKLNELHMRELEIQEDSEKN